MCCLHLAPICCRLLSPNPNHPPTALLAIVEPFHRTAVFRSALASSSQSKEMFSFPSCAVSSRFGYPIGPDGIGRVPRLRIGGPTHLTERLCRSVLSVWAVGNMLNTHRGQHGPFLLAVASLLQRLVVCCLFRCAYLRVLAAAPRFHGSLLTGGRVGARTISRCSPSLPCIASTPFADDRIICCTAYGTVASRKAYGE